MVHSSMPQRADSSEKTGTDAARDETEATSEICQRDPYATGVRVLGALDTGRALAHELQRARLAPIRQSVRRELDLDIIAGNPARGRPGRIARRLRLHPRRVARILDSLSYASNSQ